MLERIYELRRRYEEEKIMAIARLDVVNDIIQQYIEENEQKHSDNNEENPANEEMMENGQL